MERVWNGSVRIGADGEHRAFVAWLQSEDGRQLLARSLLTGYSLVERDGQLTVRLAADEPPAIIRFLRNHRFWPEFWEFKSADPSQALGQDLDSAVRWRRQS